jgi:hypothetical protein
VNVKLEMWSLASMGFGGSLAAVVEYCDSISHEVGTLLWTCTDVVTDDIFVDTPTRKVK